MLEGMNPPPKSVPMCKIMLVHDSLDPADQKIFLEAVDNVDDWSSDVLARELGKRGLTVGRETIRVHRRGDCRCVSL